MKGSVFQIRHFLGRWILLSAFAAFLGLFFAPVALGQSTLRDYPTAITSSEISGVIAPKPLGDSRITTYYYYFNGDQGDIFINLVTENLAGDIDVFSFDGVRLLTRVVVLAGTEPSETGRVVYLRKPEKLLIRVQGRTPNDDPAKFRLKFAGSFLAVNENEATPVPELPSVPKPVVEEKPVDAARTGEVARVDERPAAEPEDRKAQEEETRPAKPEVVITELKTGEAAKPPVLPDTRRRDRRTRNVPPMTDRKADADTAAKPTAEKESDPMVNFGLVILFRDGSRISRPMTEVLRFTIDRGVLTVIGKDGRVGRYSMRDIERVGIE